MADVEELKSGMPKARRFAAALALAFALGLAACQEEGGISVLFPNKAETPIPAHLKKKMAEEGMRASSPIFIRIFKEEDLVEVWKAKSDGRYGLLAEYEICKWSGKLGPKFKEGDRQAPEGFYSIRPWQMNPKSDYYLSFNLGYPNAYDRTHGRTGAHLMVHGACSSAGCYSMTDERMAEIFALAREAFKGGQAEFQVQALPFRMSAENMARHRNSEHFEFWKMLKEGYDHFELTKTPPKVDVCERRYVFNQVPTDEKAKFQPDKECPEMAMPQTLAVAYAERLRKEEDLLRRELKKEALRAAWRGEKPDSAATEALSLVYNPEADPGARRPDDNLQAGVELPNPASIPVPQVAPRPAAEPEPEKPKRRGFFALFTKG